MSIHILGNGPISVALKSELKTSFDTRIYSVLNPKVEGSLKTFPYSSFLKTTLSEKDIFILAWRGFPTENEERVAVLDYLKDNLKPENLFINISSVSVYGEASTAATEKTLPKPINEYGNTKLKLEKFCETNFKSKICQLRVSNVFGDMKFTDVVNKLMKAAEEFMPIPLMAPNIVERDFISILDVVSLIRRLIIMGSYLSHHEVFNISANESISLSMLVTVVEKTSGLKINILEEELSKSVIIKSRISNQKLVKFLSIESPGQEENLKEYISIHYLNYCRRNFPRDSK